MTSKLQATAVLFPLLLLALSKTTVAANGTLAFYWGQDGTEEQSLSEACAISGLNGTVYLAFLTNFSDGQNPALNLGDHCNSNNQKSCYEVGMEVSFCQENYKTKVLLSLQSEDDTKLNTTLHAKWLADYLWTQFLGGNTSIDSRPLGKEAKLDGIDFHIQRGDNKHYDELAEFLKAHDKHMYLSAAPRCPYPDDHLDEAIDTGLFDSVSPMFYNNRICQYDSSSPSHFYDSWRVWTNSVKGGTVYLGLPASEEAAPSGGFITNDTLTQQILPMAKQSEKYGGVVLWNRYYDRLTGYGKAIKPYV